MRATRTAARATQITFHGMRPSEELRREIRDRIDWLEQFYPPLMACRVRLQVPHRHRGHGRHLHVHIEMSLPGRPPLVITHEPSLQPTLTDAGRPPARKRDEIRAVHRYARVAIREAFDAARRRLQDAAREQRLDVKLHRRRPMRCLTALAALCLAIVPTLAQGQEPANAPPAAQKSVTAAEQTGIFTEPAIIGRALRFGNRLATSGDGGEIKNGFYPEFGDMITGAGWISGGPGYRYWFMQDRVFVDASAALSWRMYKMAQARVELPRLARSRITAGAQARWQDLTQVTYFGTGPDSLTANRSEYRLENANILGYVIGKPAQWLAISGKAGWLTRPSIHAPGGTFERGYADTATMFPDDPVYRLVEQPDFLYEEISVTADTRDHRGYPMSGGIYQTSWARYTDRMADRFTFQRYEAEAAQFVPLASSRIVLVAHGWLAGTRVEPDRVVPFYLQPSLGSASSLRSYADYRFHDRHLLMVNAEVRVRLFTHLDWAVFADAGNVAATAGDLNLDRRSYGLGFRVHTERATIARIDAAHGDEGWRLTFRINDPFRLSRIGKRTAPLPFAP